jgi:hypothetical protein
MIYEPVEGFPFIEHPVSRAALIQYLPVFGAMAPIW